MFEITIGAFLISLIQFIKNSKIAHRVIILYLFLNFFNCFTPEFTPLYGGHLWWFFILIFTFLALILLNHTNEIDSSIITVIIVQILMIKLLIETTNWINLFFYLEIFNLTIYILLNTSNNPYNTIKYLFLSAFTSSLILISIALIYFELGNLDIQTTFLFFNTNIDISSKLITIALLFKLGVVPLHNWSPDIYSKLEKTICCFLIIIPKICLIYLCTRLPVDPQLLFILGGITTFIGSICLFQQILLIRFLIYSTIYNMGFFLLLIPSSKPILLINLIIYSITLFNIFFIIHIFEILLNRSINFIDELKGIGKQFPILSILLVINLFSLGSLPPFAGFIAKFQFLLEILTHIESSWALLVLILSGSLIGIFNYLKLTFNIFTSNKNPQEIKINSKIENYCQIVIFLTFVINSIFIWFWIFIH
jgi:NADH-quinone oxidoreductase subunit N